LQFTIPAALNWLVRFDQPDDLYTDTVETLMSNADDTVIIREIVQKLRSHLADLDVELGEEGSMSSPALDAAEEILQDAIRRLETELERLA
jgi:hypothetical protein